MRFKLFKQSQQPAEAHPLTDEERRIYDERIAKAEKGFFGFFLKRQRIVFFILLIIFLWGLLAAATLPREANPEVKIPIAVVTTVWPGASPSEVEELVTNKLEAKLENLDGLKELTSSSSVGISQVVAEFEVEEDLAEAVRRTRDKVREVTDLPDDLPDDPIVTEVRFDDIPIITFSLVGDLTDRELKELADDTQDALDAINGVSEVQIIGARDREFQVIVDPGRLSQFSLTLVDVARAIASANVSLPLGDFELEGKNYTLRAVGKLGTVEELSKIVIKNTPDGPVQLRDLGRVEDALSEVKNFSRISIDGQEPKNTLSLQVFKQTGGNIIDIADQAKMEVEELKSRGVIPTGVEVAVTNDNSEFIRDDLSTLGRSGLQTVILIIVALSLALAFRMAVIAAISIPLIFLMALGVVQLQGSTLNSLTLFSLVLSLGLLVDTVIVLIEGIYDALRKGYQPRQAALYSVQTYKAPITAGVLTTIAAFVPMFLVSGIVGDFLKTMPLTIAAVLGSSLFVALIIMPGIAASFIAWATRKHDIHKNKYAHDFIENLIRRYRPTVRKLLAHKKPRRRFIASLVILLLLGFGLLGSGVIKTELFPKVDIDFYWVNIELPRGTVLEETSEFARQVEARLAGRPEIENFVTNIGSSFAGSLFESGGASSNVASIVVNLVEPNDRELKSYEYSASMREVLRDLHGEARITVTDPEGGPPTSEPIEIQVIGPELQPTSEIAADIKTLLTGVQGVVDIQSTDKPLPPEFTFRLDHEAVGRFGLTAAAVEQNLRGAIEGFTASEVELDGEDVDIVLEYDLPEVLSADELNNIELPTLDGRIIKLEQVATLQLEPALEVIRHIDRDRVVKITARNEARSVAEIQIDMRNLVAGLDLPDGYRIDTTGEFEDETQAFTDLYYAMILAILLIAFLMVAQFDSFRQTIAVLMTLPLAFIGVLGGVLIFGLPFGFASFLGIVALAGIVVNDAIVLIDRINKNLLERQLTLQEAVAEAGEARLQPILLTTVTTVLGVIPLAFADEFWFGLTVSLGAGLIFATVLTLFVIPIFYQAVMRKKIERQQLSQ